MMRLLYYLPLLLLSACASHHATTTPPVASEPIAAPVAPESDTTRTPLGHVSEPKRSLIDKVFNRTYDKHNGTTSKNALISKEGINALKKCKGCTFNVVAGDQNNAAKKATLQGAGATTITTGKKSGPVVSADSGAAVHLATSGTGIAQAGAGNTATMPAPAPKPSFWQRFKWPALGLGTIAAIAAGVYLWPVLSPGFAWFIALFRRKKETDTTTV